MNNINLYISGIVFRCPIYHIYLKHEIHLTCLLANSFKCDLGVPRILW